MKLESTQSDDPSFVQLIAKILDSVVSQYSPEILTVIQIDNWFDHKWLNFSGKVLGALGVWKSELTLPPFHPNRVISQATSRLTDGQYQQFEAPPLHVLQQSDENLNRKVRCQTKSGVFAWWSGNTLANGRGSLMVYAEIEDQPSTWFLGFQRNGKWKISKKNGIADVLLKEYTKDVEPGVPSDA